MRRETNAALAKRIGKPGGAPARYSVVAIGGSAGAFESVGTILRDLPADFPAPILVVIHLHPNYTSHAAEILRRHTELTVKDAEEQDALQGGVVYMAPRNRHLLVSSGRILLSDTPAVHFSRPALDQTFNSVVQAYGSHVIGVVLSGFGKDGAEGLRTIKAAGGFTIVEDPLTARFPAMPTAAASSAAVDRTLPLKEIAPLLVKLAGRVRESAGR